MITAMPREGGPGEPPPPPPPPPSKRLPWTPRAQDREFLSKLLKADLEALSFPECRWAPLRERPEPSDPETTLYKLMVVDRARYGACLAAVKENLPVTRERDVPPKPNQQMLAIYEPCQVVAKDVSAVAAAGTGCSPFQVTRTVAPELRDLSALLSSIGVVAKVMMSEGRLGDAVQLLTDLARFTQIAVAGRTDLQLGNAMVTVWMNQGHDLFRHILQSSHLHPNVLRDLVGELTTLIDSEPSVADLYLTDGIAMQMQVTLPIFFGSKWVPPVGWNKVMHPGGAREKAKPLLAPVGSPVESMFLYLYSRLKAQDLRAACHGQGLEVSCLNAVLRSFKEEIQINREPSRWQRFVQGREAWGTLRTLTFMVAAEEQMLRMPDFSTALVDFYRRVASLYHLRFHAMVLIAQEEDRLGANPDQFRTQAWKPYVFERHFGQDTGISQVNGAFGLNSGFANLVGGRPIASGFAYEFSLNQR